MQRNALSILLVERLGEFITVKGDTAYKSEFCIYLYPFLSVVSNKGIRARPWMISSGPV